MAGLYYQSVAFFFQVTCSLAHKLSVREEKKKKEEEELRIACVVYVLSYMIAMKIEERQEKEEELQSSEE
jgi:hypothetical protein